ncbi:MAG: DsbA family protein [Myxococcota bacterium]
MTQPTFKKMGGASNSDPSALRRWATSMLMRRFASLSQRDKQRVRFEKQRQRRGEPHRVEYFHQVEDPYSHLSAQVLGRFTDAYDVEFVPHMVGAPPGANAPEPEMLLPYSQHDCELVASHFGLRFLPGIKPPNRNRIDLANRVLAGASSSTFGERAIQVGDALWSNSDQELDALEIQLGSSSASDAEKQLNDGNARRAELGHYSGAMFHYGGEWYWGIDRLYHLEQRLMALGLRRDGSEQVLVPRPPVESGPLRDDGSLTLEFFPSIRSPYSSIIFDRVVELAEDAGVKMVTRPVLPMVMRGAPVTFIKGKYIFSDTAREAETLGLPWGHAYDPIGRPVRRAFALFPWAEEQGKGAALVGHFMRLAWREGVNTDTLKGLRRVVEAAGLDWSDARQRIDDPAWEAVIESHRTTMYADGLWGVPSYRLLDDDGTSLLSIWGQDRLWLVSRTIQATLREQQGGA